MTKEIDLTKYIGIEWAPGGRDMRGMDCWGLFSNFYRDELGIDIKEQYDLMPGIHTKSIVSAMKEATDSNNWKFIMAPKEMCGVALSKNKKIHHVGVWVKGGCLHAVKNVGVVHSTIQNLILNGYTKVNFYEWTGTR